MSGCRCRGAITLLSTPDGSAKFMPPFLLSLSSSISNRWRKIGRKNLDRRFLLEQWWWNGKRLFEIYRFLFFLFIVCVYIEEMRVIYKIAKYGFVQMHLIARPGRSFPGKEKSEGMGAREGRGGWAKLELWALAIGNIGSKMSMRARFLSRILCQYIVSAK